MPTNSLPNDQALDSIDRKLLEMIQTDFPLDPHPYRVLGRRLGIGESEALERVHTLRKCGIVRRIGANFQSAKLGFRSTLCAAKIPSESFQMFVEEINKHPGITHNYHRNNVYNIWFTLIGPSWESVCADLASITAKTGIPILNLPARKLYKIRVDFSMEG